MANRHSSSLTAATLKNHLGMTLPLWAQAYCMPTSLLTKCHHVAKWLNNQSGPRQLFWGCLCGRLLKPTKASGFEIDRRGWASSEKLDANYNKDKKVVSRSKTWSGPIGFGTQSSLKRILFLPFLSVDANLAKGLVGADSRQLNRPLKECDIPSQLFSLVSWPRH